MEGSGNSSSNFRENGAFLAELQAAVALVGVGTPAAPALDVVLGDESGKSSVADPDDF